MRYSNIYICVGLISYRPFTKWDAHPRQLPINRNLGCCHNHPKTEVLPGNDGDFLPEDGTNKEFKSKHPDSTKKHGDLQK